MIQILWNCSKPFSAVAMQNIKKVFILSFQIIHTDFRNSSLEPSTLKRLHWISFLMKIAYLRTAFTLHLHVCSCVGKTEKQ